MTRTRSLSSAGRHHIVIDNQYYAHVNMGVMSRDFFFNPHAEADF